MRLQHFVLCAALAVMIAGCTPAEMTPPREVIPPPVNAQLAARQPLKLMSSDYTGSVSHMYRTCDGTTAVYFATNNHSYGRMEVIPDSPACM